MKNKLFTNVISTLKVCERTPKLVGTLVPYMQQKTCANGGKYEVR